MREIKKSAFWCTCLAIIAIAAIVITIALTQPQLLEGSILLEAFAAIAGLGGVYTWKRTNLDKQQEGNGNAGVSDIG